MNYPKWNSSNRSTNQSHLSLQLTVPFIYFTCLQLNDSWLPYSICFLPFFYYPSSSISQYLYTRLAPFGQQRLIYIPPNFFIPSPRRTRILKSPSIPRRKISTCVLLLEEITLQKSLHRSLPPNGLIPEKSRHGINPEPGVFVLRVSFKIMITVYW